MSSHGQILSKKSTIRFLALGDSYTIGESVSESQSWPVQLATALSALGYRVETPDVVAVTGWRTDDLRKGLLARNMSTNYALVSLLVGVNNQFQGRSISEYEREFEQLLEMAVSYAGGDKRRVIVLSIPDYGFTPFGRDKQKKISEMINAFNDVNRRVTKSREITYIDITDISRRGLVESGLTAEDGLHPSGNMYKLWVEKILTHLNP